MDIPKGDYQDQEFYRWLKSLEVEFLDYLYFCYKINQALELKSPTHITKHHNVNPSILSSRLRNSVSKPITKAMLNKLPPEK